MLRKRSNDYLEYRPDDASDPFRERLEKILKKPVSKKRTTFMIDLDEAVGLMRMEHRTPPCSKWSYRRVKGATPEERLEPFLAERKMGSNSFALEVDLANAIHQVRRRRKSESVGKGNANRLRKRGRPDRTQA